MHEICKYFYLDTKKWNNIYIFSIKHDVSDNILKVGKHIRNRAARKMLTSISNQFVLTIIEKMLFDSLAFKEKKIESSLI